MTGTARRLEMDQSESDEVEARLAIVRARYGARLTPEQLAEIRTVVEGLVKGARSMRAIPLRNSDEPVAPFTPFRADA
jgi:hypothetical protein